MLVYCTCFMLLVCSCQHWPGLQLCTCMQGISSTCDCCCCLVKDLYTDRKKVQEQGKLYSSYWREKRTIIYNTSSNMFCSYTCSTVDYSLPLFVLHYEYSIPHGRSTHSGQSGHGRTSFARHQYMHAQCCISRGRLCTSSLLLRLLVNCSSLTLGRQQSN